MTERILPVRIGTDNDWVTISAGRNHSIAIKEDGSLWAWGSNDEGQIGDDTIHTDHTSPTRVGTDNDWVKVSAGHYQTMALKIDGSLWAWGEGYLGDTDVYSQCRTPVRVGTDNDWTTISSGRDHTLALKSNGNLWAWGGNLNGQLGDSSMYVARREPFQIESDNDWSILDASYHSVAIKNDCSLWTWGYNWFGELGNGTTQIGYIPARMGLDNDWTTVAAGHYHTVALKSDGSLWAWGDNSDGEIGDGTTIRRTTPTRIGLDNDWGFVSAKNNYSMDFTIDVLEMVSKQQQYTVIDENNTTLQTEEPEEPEEPTIPFTDVVNSDWFYDNVVFAFNNKLMNGTSSNTFCPQISLTRGMILTILYRNAGLPDTINIDNPFYDVDENAYFYNAVKWAASNKIVFGNDGNYEPLANITRQDLAVILFRYADFTNIELVPKRDYIGFFDDSDIAAYAKKAVEALFESEIINGRTGNWFDPKGDITRAETAAVLHRFFAKTEK